MTPSGTDTNKPYQICFLSSVLKYACMQAGRKTDRDRTSSYTETPCMLSKYCKIIINSYSIFCGLFNKVVLAQKIFHKVNE
jgi:hypothetical protein